MKIGAHVKIHGPNVFDSSISATAIEFEHSRVKAASVHLDPQDDGYAAGSKIARELETEDLRLVFVLSNGIRVNGSRLISSMREIFNESIPLTGGLAGDGPRFQTTRVGLNGMPEASNVLAIGFYGEALTIGHGCEGGWDVFGPERRITAAKGNILYELDGKPALDLYKRYLGEDAQGLPGNALLFPLRVYQAGQKDHSIVRTIVGIDEQAKAMIFAGDMPNGHCAQLMRGNIDRLVEGAGDAARATQPCAGENVALLVSCIGRKLLLGQRATEEVEAVSQILGNGAAITGFYSYGEISPHAVSGLCELHNQTMTVTVIGER
jgi:hypothetical protein